MPAKPRRWQYTVVISYETISYPDRSHQHILSKQMGFSMVITYQREDSSNVHLLYFTFSVHVCTTTFSKSATPAHSWFLFSAASLPLSLKNAGPRCRGRGADGAPTKIISDKGGAFVQKIKTTPHDPIWKFFFWYISASACILFFLLFTLLYHSTE